MMFARTRYVGVAALAGACASAPRNPVLDTYPPGVAGRTTVDYYDVHGRTIAELRADMRRLGPKVGDSSFVGETRSPMRWTWRTESTGAASCAIRDVSVTVNAQILLPRWTPPPDTEPGVAAEWTRFIAALETHEAGHKDISAKAGNEIVQQLRGLTALCSMLSSNAGDITRRITDRAEEAQRKYDADTRHGLTQGTAFGPRTVMGIVLSASDPLTLLPAPRPGTVRAPISVPIERAWTALPAAFAATNLRVNAADSSAHAMGDSLSAHGTIGTQAVSELLDCGAPPAGWNADSVDVALFVTARLTASAAGTTLTNTVQAVAHPRGAPPILCRSRGAIERRLLDALRGVLARAG